MRSKEYIKISSVIPCYIDMISSPVLDDFFTPKRVFDIYIRPLSVRGVDMLTIVWPPLGEMAGIDRVTILMALY